MREHFAAFVRSKEFEPYFRRIKRPPKWRYIIAVPFAISITGIPIALGLLWSARTSARERKLWRAQLADWAARARPIWTYPVIVNPAINQDPSAIAPGLVIGSFDPEVDGDRAALEAIADRLGEAYFGDEAGPDADLTAFMRDDTYQPDRRRPLPLRITGGKHVFAFDLMMPGPFLPPALIRPELIPCLADPGPKGRIEVVPNWIAGEPPGEES